MKKFKLPTNVTRTFHKVGFGLKKHSPEILVAAGVIGIASSFVMACKAAMDTGEILEEAKEQVEAIKETEFVVETIEDKAVADHNRSKALTAVYAKTGFELAKIYAPSVIICTLSVGALLTSNNILRQRNIALTAAYSSLHKGFKMYRNNVVERFGEELDHELRYNIKAREIETTKVDENGVEQTIKEIVDSYDPREISEFAVFFDELCPNYEKDSEYNKTFLLRMQSWANEKLNAKGYLFLNEVYDMIGIPRTKEGQIVGWVKDSDRGDGYVDFGIFNSEKQQAIDFVNGRERAILLDFNVDGPILDELRFFRAR